MCPQMQTRMGRMVSGDALRCRRRHTINIISNKLGIPELSLKFQDVIVPIFKMHHAKIGLTIMDGPFSSIMPKGNSKNTFLLYHPKYSVVSESSTNNFEMIQKIIRI